MSYEDCSKGYDYGLSKIYEMVINNDPCYAYLMRCNNVVDQKLVMAHVYGHCDFFKNNAYFGHTNRKMMDEMANHGARIRRYAEKFGEDEVEAFIDRCMSIDDLIDIHSTAIRRRENVALRLQPEATRRRRPRHALQEQGVHGRLHQPARGAQEEEEADPQGKRTDRPQFPRAARKRRAAVLIEHAPLKNWQRDILSIVRDEAYYFAPQGQTKISTKAGRATGIRR